MNETEIPFHDRREFYLYLRRKLDNDVPFTSY